MYYVFSGCLSLPKIEPIGPGLHIHTGDHHFFYKLDMYSYKPHLIQFNAFYSFQMLKIDFFIINNNYVHLSTFNWGMKMRKYKVIGLPVALLANNLVNTPKS